MNKKIITITLALIILVCLSVLNIHGQETQIPDFNLDEVQTWHQDWTQIKSRLKTDPQGINTEWSSTEKQERSSCLDNLINKGQTTKVKITNLDSENLKLDEEGKLTTGNAQLNLEELPSNIKEIEYKDQEKAFVYKFENGMQITIRKGTLNQDLTITGTGWPSDGLL